MNLETRDWDSKTCYFNAGKTWRSFNRSNNSGAIYVPQMYLSIFDEDHPLRCWDYLSFLIPLSHIVSIAIIAF